jgi:hypothetical protein
MPRHRLTAALQEALPILRRRYPRAKILIDDATLTVMWGGAGHYVRVQDGAVNPEGGVIITESISVRGRTVAEAVANWDAARR